MIMVRTLVVSSVQILRGIQLRTVTLAEACSRMCDPVVTVKQGKLRGAVIESVISSPYIAFKGIPFAAPPIGDLRFKDPQPPEPWTGIRDTSEIVVRPCPQLEQLPPFEPFGDEDCLYLNVYTNSLNQSKPVMFWIHGGAFILGSASFEYTRPDYLLAKDVVVVTAHYRLGAFGFLNLGHPVAPGNQGLKDLIAALKWVNENIANFGGDPNNVTIFGVSAGGALAHYLMLSPSAKGLFHKAILQSGTALASWSVNQCRPERSFKLASLLGKDSTDPVEVIEFLRSVPAEEIAKAQSTILTKQETAAYNLAFGVNCDEMAENPVMPGPLEELEEADIPVIIGQTSHEFVMYLKDKSDHTLQIFNYFMPQHAQNMGALKKLGEEECKVLLEDIKTHYFDGKPVCEETLLGLADFITDIYFGVPARIALENRMKKATAPAYFYRFSYVGNEKTPTDLLLKRVINGASHVDDIAYLLYLPLCKTENPDAPAIGSKDRITLERMTTFWTNFAKTGDPNSGKNEFINTTWKPSTVNEPYYLEIGDELQSLLLQPHVLSNK